MLKRLVCIVFSLLSCWPSYAALTEKECVTTDFNEDVETNVRRSVELPNDVLAIIFEFYNNGKKNVRVNFVEWGIMIFPILSQCQRDMKIQLAPL